MDWQAPETLETRVWETRLGSNLERSRWRLTLRWERSPLLRGSCRFLRDKNEKCNGANLKKV